MPSPAVRPAGSTPSKKPATGPSAMGGMALVGTLGLIAGLVVGYGVGRVSTGTPINPLAPPAPAGTGTSTGTDVAERLRDAGLLPPALTETTSLSGTAVAVEEARLTFDADLLPFDPTGEKKLPVRRTANVSASTEIVRLVQKTPAELAADQQASADASAKNPDGPPPAPPSGFKEVRIALSDISAGESVTVTAASDILSAQTFDATRIVVAPAVEAAAPPPTPTTTPEPEPTPPPAP
ncbi:MAG TPA: hypothetical protein VL283_01625 [Candidatus Baltobacteraceae bacterium]|nr:hypothetical protein [Candidatus Baltobacteraceae bacterium]